MLDINLVRAPPEEVRAALERRSMASDVVDQVQALDVERRRLLIEVESLKAERNTVSRQIGQMQDPAARQEKIAAMKQVGDRIAALDEQVRQAEEKLQALVATI